MSRAEQAQNGLPGLDERLRPTADRGKLRLRVFWALIAALFFVSLWQTGFTPWRLLSSVDNVVNLLQRMWPPSFVEWERYVRALVVTLWMVFAGTALALMMSVPLAVLAARNTTTGRVAYSFSRAVITFTRAVPDIVFALIFVRAIGLGPTAGVLAIALNSVGMVGKFYSDRIEEIDEGPVEALRTTGATRLQVLSTAVMPQVLTNWIALALYRVDINIRSAVIIGFVGGGGIGVELQRVQGQLAYQRLMAIVLIIFVLIVATEKISDAVRRAIVGEDAGYDANPFKLRNRIRNARASTSSPRLSEPGAVDEGPVGSLLSDAPVKPKPSSRLRPPRNLNDVKKWTLSWGALALILTSFALLGLTPWRLLAATADIIPYIGSMFPPDFVTNFDRFAPLMLETLWMALAATVLGMVLSLPVGVLAARNASPSFLVYRLGRWATIVVRGIPELILAVIFVVAVGLGPFAGVLALTIGSIGMSAKLIADAIEDTPLSQSTEALRAVGATWLQRTFTVTLPQAMPAIVGVGIYTFDVYVRAAAILGIVGAGGIGIALDATVRTGAFDQTLAVILWIFATVYAVERLSGWVRSQVL